MTKAPGISRSRGKSRPKDARQQFATLQRSHHEPALPAASTGPAYPSPTVLTVHGVRNLHRLDIPFRQVLETRLTEHQRPVNAGAKHTGMVCNPKSLRQTSPRAIGHLDDGHSGRSSAHEVVSEAGLLCKCLILWCAWQESNLRPSD